MKNKLSCEVVQDLLPLYVDELTSDATNEEIRDHIESCRECRKKLERMQEPEHNSGYELQKKELDFLKKTRKKTQKSILVSISLVVLILLILTSVRLFFVGNELYADSVACKVSVSGKVVEITGISTESGRGISVVNFQEKDGIVSISFKGVLASPWCSGDFQESYEAEQTITQVKIGDRIVWDQGESILASTSAVYNAKHLYVGDMSANGRSAIALGISNGLGEFKSELQTTEEPYGWHMILQENIVRDNHEKAELQMKSYAYVLLATINNLGYVKYEYQLDNENVSLSITEEDASVFVGKDIKTCAETPAELQKLMMSLHLDEYAVPDLQTYSGHVQINIVQNTDAEIYGLTTHFYTNGLLHESGIMENANGSYIAKGEKIKYETATDIVGASGEISPEIRIEVEITDKNGNVYKAEVPEEMYLKIGYSYTYVLSGNYENGFIIEQ